MSYYDIPGPYRIITRSYCVITVLCCIITMPGCFNTVLYCVIRLCVQLYRHSAPVWYPSPLGRPQTVQLYHLSALVWYPRALLHPQTVQLYHHCILVFNSALFHNFSALLWQHSVLFWHHSILVYSIALVEWHKVPVVTDSNRKTRIVKYAGFLHWKGCVYLFSI